MAFRLMICCGKDFDGEFNRKNKAAWRVFSFKEMLAATNNFNYDNKLGEGAIGNVYWGQLSDGSEIAVKSLKGWGDKSEMEFVVEVRTLSRVHHKNLLNIRGYCAEGQERLIVSDYMPNLSLFYHLHRQQSVECVLDWKRRVNIATGSAEGIAYLHRHSTPRIIHRGIKASNILLDSDFQAKVADFQFELMPAGTRDAATKVKDTLGYLAPEYAMLGKASESCDVFSFGILLLELVSGRRALQKLNPGMNQSISDWAFPLAREGNFRLIADPKLNENYDEQELRRIVVVALMSAQKQPEQRPTMLKVVALLKGEAEDKLAKLEEELFRNWQYADGQEESSEDSSLTVERFETGTNESC